MWYVKSISIKLFFKEEKKMRVWKGIGSSGKKGNVRFENRNEQQRKVGR